MEASSITTEIIQWATKIERTHSSSNILGEDSSLSAFKWSTAVDLSKVSISSLTLHWLANVWWYSIPCHIVCALPCRLEVLRSRRYEAETKSISFGFSRAFRAIIPVDVIFASFAVARGEKEYSRNISNTHLIHILPFLLRLIMPCFPRRSDKSL